MKKTHSIVFNDKEIILSKEGLNITDKNSILLKSNRIGNIINSLKKLHSDHIKEVTAGNFEANTKAFLKNIITDLSDNVHMKDTWEKVLLDIKKEIEDQLEAEITENPNDAYYPHRIKILDSSIDIKKHTVTTIIKNLKNDLIVQTIVSLTMEPLVKATIEMKTGTIMFKQNYCIQGEKHLD